MSAIRFQRPADRGGLMRRLAVELDGETVAALSYKSEHTVEVPPGTYQVQGRMDWATSPVLSVTVLAEDTVHVQVAFPLRGAFRAIWRAESALDIREL